MFRASRRSESLADRIVKVDHAGEHGAVNIYAGQIVVARLLYPSLIPRLLEFRSHERRHRALFAAELRRRRQPQCRSYHLCGIGGFCLGIVSALAGKSAIAATTVAVERVVLRHLQQQLDQLRSTDPHAYAAVSTILADEQAHHDESLGMVIRGGIADRLFSPLVAGSTEAVIRLGMRL